MHSSFRYLICSFGLLALMSCGTEREPLFALSRFVIRIDQSVPTTAINRFFDECLTPSFPAGVTRIEGQQQWRNANDTLTSAPCVIFDIIHLANADNATRIDGALFLAKRQFGPHAVMLIQGRPDVRF